MDGGASIIAFTQAAQSCVKIGQELFLRYKAYKHSDDRLTELILRAEKSWLKTAVQLEVLDKIRHELDSRLIDCFDAYASRLETKLRSARIELESLTNLNSSDINLDRISFKLTRFKRARYSAFGAHVHRTVAELESWQTGFDPSWLFLIRLSSAEMDSALTQQLQATQKISVLENVQEIRATLRDIETNRSSGETVFRDDDFISPNRVPLATSSLQVASTTVSAQDVLLDTTDYPVETNVADIRRQVRDLARILMHGDPAILGLLRCLGVLQVIADNQTLHRYQFIYAIPENSRHPITLRCLLSEPSLSLDAKFCLARAISRSVASVHAAGFVHKNMRPENLLVFNEDDSQMPTAFLVGFERFRGVYDTTTLTGDMVWHRNLYRHPTRQGRRPDEVYQMQHDIYSLGVCLLEIGLWTSFVLQNDTPELGPLLDISAELMMNNKRQAALEIKRKLIEMANEKLPALMGLVYTQVVMSCLTCLDSKANNMFTYDTDLRDEDGILVGVAFIERIFTRLASINISD